MADSSAHRPSVTKDGECESQFRHCNECETKANPNYEGCSHPEDPPEFENQLENPVRPPYNVNLHNFDWHHTPGWLLNLYDMIKSNSLTHLFDENHDETCNGIFLCTVRGDLVGKGASTDGTTSKRASVLGALTWRFHSAVSIGADPSKVCRVRPLKTIKLVQATDNKQYKSIIVDLDGQAVALEYVKEYLLLGVLGFGTGLQVEELNGADQSIKAEGNQEVGPREGHLAASDLRMLELKAEGMAEYIRAELKEFVMPQQEIDREQM